MALIYIILSIWHKNETGIPIAFFKIISEFIMHSNADCLFISAVLLIDRAKSAIGTMPWWWAAAMFSLEKQHYKYIITIFWLTGSINFSETTSLGLGHSSRWVCGNLIHKLYIILDFYIMSFTIGTRYSMCDTKTYIVNTGSL